MNEHGEPNSEDLNHDDHLDDATSYSSEDPETDDSFSLDELSQAYAELLGRRAAESDEPSSEDAPPRDAAGDREDSNEQPSTQVAPGAATEQAPQATTDEPTDATTSASANLHETLQSQTGAQTDAPSDDACEISPRSIVEAVLFVGHPENQPLTNKEIAKLMRGVEPSEVDDLVAELNRIYEEEECPYHIVSEGAGYRMALTGQYDALREKFYGRIKEARLSQAAIDVLAIVAYNQPITRERVDKLRGKPSSALLSQLVRRGLLRIERPDEKPRTPSYFTTQRFLEVFHLDHLDDLPHAEELVG